MQEPSNLASFQPLDTDMILYLRDQIPVIQAPKNQGGMVPDDFLILVAVAASWHDEEFRDLMMVRVQKMLAAGALDGMVKRNDHKPH